MKPSIIRKEALEATPWPNGQGITKDIISHPSLDGGFHWLISIATIEVDADFSRFDNCCRILTLVDGAGIDLVFDRAEKLRCLPMVPLAFPGDRPVRCQVTDGPARVLNVFAREPGGKLTVSAMTLASGYHLELQGSPVAIYCASGSAKIGEQQLRPGDTAVGAGRPTIASSDEAAGLVMVHLSGSSEG